MADYDYDLFVIGAGSGGVRASRVAAAYGAKVAVAEERYLGGTCVNVGCIPKKLLVYASHFGADFEDAAGFGWAVGARTNDWATLIARKDAEIARLNGVYARLLDKAGVHRIEGRATLLDAHTVSVAGRKHRARYILIATGSWPFVPPIPGVELGITSNEVFHLERRPERVLIAGGGYIAVEFAGIFKGLGSQVSLAYRGPVFLRGFDDDLRHTLADEMRKAGVDLRFNSDLTAIERSGHCLRATLTTGDVVETDCVLLATGRLPNTDGLGLEMTSVERTLDGAIVVDAYCRTEEPNIYAIGDVIDRFRLTPVAIAEGRAVAETLFNDNPTVPDYREIPTAVFSQPPIGTVGLTEEEARKRHGEVDVYRTNFRPLKHTLSGRHEHTMMKLVVDRATDRVLGCHMVGADAGEILQGFAVALRCNATKAQFDATIGIHPTAAEEFVTMKTKVEAP